MAYQGSKFSSRMVKDIFPHYYTGRDDCDNIVNTMLRYFLSKKYKEDIVKQNINTLENQCAFYETSIYSGRDIPRIIDTIENQHEEMLLVVKVDDNSRIKDTMDKVGKGFIELNTPDCPINQFLLTQTKRITNVFVNKENHYVVVFTQNDPIESWYIQLFSCSIKIWSWLFEDATEVEMQMFKALNEKDLNKFTLIINQFFPDNIFEILKLEKLSQYSTVGIKNKIRSVETEIQRLDRNINDIHESLKQNLETRMDRILQLEGLRYSFQKEDNNMVEYFNNRKNITINEINIDAIHKPVLFYSIQETLEYYDVDEFKRIVGNSDSWFNQHELCDEDIKKVLTAIFIEDKGKLCVQSEFELRDTSSISAHRFGCLSDISYKNYMPHPHLGFYACLGMNEPQIDNFLMQGNWDLAIDQTIASTKNLAFGDSAVMDKTISYISSNRHDKYILADNGEKMSVEEFLKYLENNKKAGNNNE